MKFDENGSAIPRISKNEIKFAIAKTRSEIISENYKCKCGGDLQLYYVLYEYNVKCKSCGTITDNKTLRSWAKNATTE